MNDGATEQPAPLSVVIVGAGIIGANHAAALLRQPRLRIVAVVDPVAAAGEQLAARVAAVAGAAPDRYDTLAAALAGHRPQLVVICTPSGQHAAQAVEALAAGAHVVVEKPLDVSLHRARPLIEVAAGAVSRGLTLSVISQHRFDPPMAAVAEAIADGRLGRLTSAVASVPWWRGQDYYDSASWRGTRELDGGGALMNQGVHTVDLLVWLFGRPSEVFAYTGRLAHDGIEVEDVAVATLRFPSGALATLHATTAAYPGVGVRLQIHGSRGTAIIHDDQLEYFHAAGGDEPAPADQAVNQAAGLVAPAQLYGADKPSDNFLAGHLRQYEDIVDAIDRGRPPRVGLEDGLLALAVVEAVYRSADLGRAVRVDELLPDVAPAAETSAEQR